jgi:hypothetical protein
MRVEQIKQSLLRLQAVGRIAKLRNDYACKAWDWWHGVDTAGTVHLSTLTIHSPNAREAGVYASTHPALVSEMFEGLDVDLRKFVFVDFGSGKGRILLQASEYPFRKIIGVEFAKELHEVALANVRRFRRANQKCGQIELVHADVTEYELPPVPEIIYLYSPFRPTLMSAVLENLGRSLRSYPRELVLVIQNPAWAACVEQLPGFADFCVVKRTKYYNVYRPSGALC